MRRLTTWILILALVLLALCVLWLLPRLLRDDPPPEQNLASSAPAETSAPVEISAPSAQGAEGSPTTPAPPPSGATTAVAERAARAPGSAARRSSLRGRVLDRGGKSVPGALVLAAHAPDVGAPIALDEAWISHLPLDVARPEDLGAEVPAAATTDELGVFEFPEFEPGRVRLAVRSTRHAPLDRNDLRLGREQDLDVGDLVLDAPSWIDGSLWSVQDLPLQDLRVVVSEPFAGSLLPPLAPEWGPPAAASDARGRFRAGPFGPGPRTLHALGGPRFEDARIDVDDARAGGEFLATMPDAELVSGWVPVRGGAPDDLFVRAVPAETARLAVPFHARADARNARVRRDGAFELEGLTPGVIYELRAGRIADRFEDANAWSPPSIVAAGELGVRVRWSAEASLAFDLVDARDRSPLGSCRVDFEGAVPASAVLSGADGPREVAGLRPTVASNRIDVLVRSRGSVPAKRTVELRPAAVADLGEVALDPAPRLTVHVVDRGTKAPVRGAGVTATEIATGRDPSGLDPAAVLTDESGDAVVASYFGAGSRVEVEAPGYARASRIGPFGYGYSAPRLEIELVPGATARIRVVGEDERPIAGARVEWVEGDWTPPIGRTRASPRPIAERPDPRTSRLTDGDGRVAFDGLAPGRHAFHVQRRRPVFLDGEWTQRELREGEVQEIELRSRPPSTLEVRITDAGVPLAGAPVCLLRAEDAERSPDPCDLENPLPPGLDARLDARGRAVLGEIDAPAQDVLAIFVAGQRRRACFQLRIREGGDVAAIDLATTAVSGTVLDGEGAPFPGVGIYVADEAREAELRLRARRRTLADSEAKDLLSLAVERPAATSDEAGRFRILGLPLDRPFALVARAEPGEESPGGAGRSESLLLQRGGGPLEVSIALAPAGALEVRTRPGLEALSCTLAAIPRGTRGSGPTPRIRRLQAGRAELLAGLEPGDWDLEIVCDDRRYRDRQRVEVAAGELRAVDLRIR